MSLTSFLGRERQIADVLRIVESGETRLLTLTGPGGVGKTRLAIECLHRLEADFASGARFVPLTLIQDPHRVLQGIAQSLGVVERGSRPVLDLLAEELRDTHLLLTLDNFEHLLGIVPEWLPRLLERCPRLTVLVTSRAALAIGGEHRYQVPPLLVPDQAVDDLSRLAANDAVMLFAQRAKAMRADFRLDAGNAVTVGEICRRVDGLPLAIELAAARLASLQPVEILARLDRQLQLLRGGQQDAPKRLRSMRDAIAWSYDLLPEDEQRTFRRLAVFVGGFTLDAAEVVGGDEQESTDGEVMDRLDSLVSKSLIQPATMDNAATRYRMLEPIREFGLELLAASGEEVEIRNRHASWCLAMAQGTRLETSQMRQVLLIDRLEREHANVHGALTWLESTRQERMLLDLVNANEWLWFYGGRELEGFGWYQRVLGQAGSEAPFERLDALIGAGDLATVMTRPDADLYVEQAMSLAQESGTARQRARATFVAANLAENTGDYSTADALFRASHDFSRLAGDDWELILCDYHLGVVAWGQGHLDVAEERFERARMTALGLGDPLIPVWSLVNHALIAGERGDAARMRHLLQGHPDLDSVAGYRQHDPVVRAAVGVLASLRGNHEVAARLFGSAAHDRPLALPERFIMDRCMDRARSVLGEHQSTRAWSEGQRMRRDEVAAEIAGVLLGPESRSSQTPPPGHPASALTIREMEVLRLLADGLTNQEIADSLHVTRRTIGTHIDHILTKLNARSRTAAVAYAIRNGLT